MTRPEAIAQLTAAGQDYELIPGEVWGRPCRVFKNAPENLRALFESTRSDETFLVYEDERYTFEETWQHACALGHALTKLGVGKGDRVAVSMRNYPEWVMSFNAITSIGAVAVAMNALWSGDEMAYGLNNCGAKVLIADQERLDRLAEVISEVDLQVIAVRGENSQVPSQPWADLIAPFKGQEMPDVEVAPGDPAIIFYTSGSTGHPKGAVSCHQNVMTALFSWELEGVIAATISQLAPEELPYQAGTLLAVPLFHVTGCHAVFLMSYRAQRKMICMYKWDVDLAMELIEREKITTFVAPAAMTGDLVNAAAGSDRDLSSLAVVGGGGAPRAPEQVKKIPGAFGKAMPNTGWGMTETNAIGAGIGGEDYVEHPGSSGRCSAALDLRVVNEAGDELPANTPGELQVRGSSVIQGYWNRPEANAESFVDGWFRTGDVAVIDDEGYVYIVDRIKDLVIRGGENIGCAEVEAGLLEHDNILEASVYAVPDERLGEEVGATIYCNAPLTEEDIRSFLGERIARFKIPRYYQIAAEPLPRIASGKIDKRSLRAEAVQALGLAKA
ncbi:MAG: acyl--CoA ligase [Pseudomonadales bacterium]|nr:acyl--CoA ligase [Pseudomonadales bacterium]